ncbi:MAG: hypothetical protein M1436_02025 [Acidobacteria bacterium]|nr:hypothetical protein [Acidobacteriota bacterium]
MLSPIPQISALSGAVTTGRVAGNAGLVLFDLAAAQARILPVPEGFAAITEAGVFPATRKMVARGFLEGNEGSQLLIYDLNTGDLTGIVPNPDGVAFIGPRPAAAVTPPVPGVPGAPGASGGGAGGAGGAAAGLNVPTLLTTNPKANTVSAVALDAGGKQVGVVAVRIP